MRNFRVTHKIADGKVRSRPFDSEYEARDFAIKTVAQCRENHEQFGFSDQFVQFESIEEDGSDEKVEILFEQ